MTSADALSDPKINLRSNAAALDSNNVVKNVIKSVAWMRLKKVSFLNLRFILHTQSCVYYYLIMTRTAALIT